MALYKYATCIRQVDSLAFDAMLIPGTPALWAGIYQCDYCGQEVAVPQNEVLPPPNHHPHKSPALIQWRLIIALREE